MTKAKQLLEEFDITESKKLPDGFYAYAHDKDGKAHYHGPFGKVAANHGAFQKLMAIHKGPSDSKNTVLFHNGKEWRDHLSDSGSEVHKFDKTAEIHRTK